MNKVRSVTIRSVTFRSVTICAATVFAVAATISGCDSAPPVQANARQVTVVGSGEVQGVPDTLTADVAIEAVAADVTTAMNRTSERQQAVIDALKGPGVAGITSEDISTTTVSLQPQYGDNSTITGYRASNSISVRIREIGGASAALAAIVDAGGNETRINSVTYSIEDDAKLVNDARARAFNDAKSRASQYAELAGLSLGKVISISEAPGTAPPRPMQVGAPMAAADVPLQPGQQTVSFSVTAVWELG